MVGEATSESGSSFFDLPLVRVFCVWKIFTPEPGHSFLEVKMKS